MRGRRGAEITKTIIQHSDLYEFSLWIDIIFKIFIIFCIIFAIKIYFARKSNKDIFSIKDGKIIKSKEKISFKDLYIPIIQIMIIALVSGLIIYAIYFR